MGRVLRMTSRERFASAVLSLAITCLALPAAAQNPSDVSVVSTSPKTGLATFVTVADDQVVGGKQAARAAKAKPLDFLAQHGHLFGVRNAATELREHGTKKDLIGKAHTSYEQVHKGVPVFAGELKVHQDAGGRVRAANGKFFPIPDKLSTIPSLNVADAVAVAINDLNTGSPHVESTELVIVDPGWYGDPSLGPRLAWYIVLNGSPAALREGFFVDAHNGMVLDRWSLICHMRHREIYDAMGGWELPGTLVRSEGQEPVTDADTNLAYDYAGDTYDYYWRAFGRDSIDGAGLTLSITVNSTAPGCPNAFWDNSRMVFCPGLVTDDIMGHELTHGVTEHAAALIYQNQPGQLNESFSDVFGELIDLFNGDVSQVGEPDASVPWPAHPSPPGRDVPNHYRSNCSYSPGHEDGVRWMMGEDVPSGAIRDMWDPTCFGDPDRGYSPYQTCSPYDNGGVHSGSGIPNRAFSLLVDGGTFNGYYVDAIGPIKAGAIWYRALTVYLSVASDFQDAYMALKQSAADFARDGFEPNDPRTGTPCGTAITWVDAEQVDNALKAVEMNAPGSCGATVDILNPVPPAPCSYEQVLFLDDFEHGLNGWVVENTDPAQFTWVQAQGTLPYGRAGTVWYCNDPDVGDCISSDESGGHYLTSPPVMLPNWATNPKFSFYHYMAAENYWDGGNLAIKVDNGSWENIPGSAIEYNTYNGYLNSSGNNPMRGQPVWTGAGGGWGITVVNISSFASPGHTVRIRFNFGRDNCLGVKGWYIDDFAFYHCDSHVQADMNKDGWVDGADYSAFAACFNGSGNPIHSLCDAADLNRDGSVDGIDYGYFAACFNGTGQRPSNGCLIIPATPRPQ